MSNSKNQNKMKEFRIERGHELPGKPLNPTVYNYPLEAMKPGESFNAWEEPTAKMRLTVHGRMNYQKTRKKLKGKFAVRIYKGSIWVWRVA